MGITTQKPFYGQRSVFNDQISSQLTPEVQLHFVYGVNDKLMTTTVSGTGDVSGSDSMMVVSSGTTTSSNAEARSHHIGKYYSGQGLLCRFSAIFPSSLSGTSFCEIGMGNDEDGLFFGVDSTGFFVNRRDNSTDNVVYSTAWDNLTFELDQTKGNVYQIELAWLGFGSSIFSVQNPTTNEFDMVYKKVYANTSVIPSISNPNFPFWTYLSNGDTTDDIILKTASAGIFLQGVLDRYASSILSSFSASDTATSGTNVHLITVRVRSSYNSKTNWLKAFLKEITAAVDGTKNVRLSVSINSTIASTSYSNYDTSNSILESSTAGTVSALGQELFVMEMSKAGQGTQAFQVSESVFEIDPGDTLTVAYTTSANTDINVDLILLEDI